MANMPTSVQGATQNLQEAGAQLQQGASSVGRSAAQQAKEVASAVATKAQEAAGKAKQTTDSALSAVGEKMTSVAQSLRAHAPQEGVLGSAACTVAEKLDSGGHYLRQSGVREITNDLADVVRRHPIPAVITVFSLGLVIGMAARR